jgi:hypothetical protein
LSNYKRSIYYSLSETLGSKASVDVFIYNYNIEQFEEIVNNQMIHYDYFVILPHFKDDDATGVNIIKNNPKKESAADRPKSRIAERLSGCLSGIRKRYSDLHLKPELI